MDDFVLILIGLAVLAGLIYVGYRAYKAGQSKGSIGNRVGGARPFDDRNTRNR